MKFLKGFTCFLLALSYVALGMLFFAQHQHGTQLPHNMNFGEALLIILAVSNALHILYWLFSKHMHKRMYKEGKFDKYIDDKFHGKCCGK